MSTREISLSDAQIEEAARLFATLSEPSRLRLLKTLMSGPRTVGELVEATGLKQGNVSKQLSALTQAKFLNRERDGNFARYSIRDPLVQDLCRLVCAKIERDAHEHLGAVLAGKS
jgi:DNA-binding transcriptional ArsR family regulator